MRLKSLLQAVCSALTTIRFEATDGTDGLPLRVNPAHHDLRPVPRLDKGAHLVAQVKAGLPELLKDTPDPYVWIACDTATTRSLTAYFRKEPALPKQRVNALGYWRAA